MSRKIENGSQAETSRSINITITLKRNVVREERHRVERVSQRGSHCVVVRKMIRPVAGAPSVALIR